MMRVSHEVALMGHYRYMCDRECMENTVITDLTLLKLKDQIEPKVEKVLKILNLL